MQEDEYEAATKAILDQYGLTIICPSTVYRWMKLIGFKYEPWQKGYYIDGHEKQGTIEYWGSFVQCYQNYEQ